MLFLKKKLISAMQMVMVVVVVGNCFELPELHPVLAGVGVALDVLPAGVLVRYGLTPARNLVVCGADSVVTYHSLTVGRYHLFCLKKCTCKKS